MTQLTDLVANVNDIYWYGVIAILVFAGLYFSVTTLIVQIRMLPEMLRTITEKPSDIDPGKKGISAFRAFTISAASRVGTGNIAGCATALVSGGPGAIFWMWIAAFFGMVYFLPDVLDLFGIECGSWAAIALSLLLFFTVIMDACVFVELNTMAAIDYLFPSLFGSAQKPGFTKPFSFWRRVLSSDML